MSTEAQINTYDELALSFINATSNGPTFPQIYFLWSKIDEAALGDSRISPKEVLQRVAYLREKLLAFLSGNVEIIQQRNEVELISRLQAFVEEEAEIRKKEGKE